MLATQKQDKTSFIHYSKGAGNSSWLPDAFQNAIYQSVYQQGLADGKEDMQIELLRQNKALTELAISRVQFVTQRIIEEAQKVNIIPIQFYLKLRDWDSAESLIIVSVDDYVSDNMELLYNAIDPLILEVNSPNFSWSFAFTYYSDAFNRDKLHTDGFSYIYEHTPQSRQAQ